MSLMHFLLIRIDADMKSEIGSTRQDLWPYPLRFHVKEVGADAKLNPLGPLGVANHHRHNHQYCYHWFMLLKWPSPKSLIVTYCINNLVNMIKNWDIDISLTTEIYFFCLKTGKIIF